MGGHSHWLVFKEEKLTQISQVKGSKGIPWTSQDKALIPAWTPVETAPSSVVGSASVLASTLFPKSQNCGGDAWIRMKALELQSTG